MNWRCIIAHLSNGTQVFVEGSRGAAIDVTAISNAANPVLTVSNASGLAKGDYLLFTSSASTLLADKQVRVTEVSDTSVTVEGIDISSAKLPAGLTGEVVKITSWFEVPCVQDVSTDGGEQQFVNFQCLSDDREQQIPTYKSAVTNTFTFAHEYTNPVYPVLRNYDESGQVVAIRLFVPRAQEMRLQSGTIAFNDTPTIGINEIETVSIAVSIRGRLSSVAAEV
nr:MAG TPA: tail tube protein [Caudoviricetes sp.]